MILLFFFFFSSRRRHTRYIGDWSSDVCSSDLRAGRTGVHAGIAAAKHHGETRLLQSTVDGALQVRRGSEIAGPQLRAVGEQPRQRSYRHETTVERDLWLAATEGQLQGRSEERRVGKEWRSE